MQRAHAACQMAVVRGLSCAASQTPYHRGVVSGLRRASWCLSPAVLCLTLAVTAQEAAVPPHERARPKDASALFARMATVRGLEATFTEEKHVALLALPLRSEGRLFFHRPEADGPGWLTRLVEKPEPASVRIAPRELRIENRDGTEVIDLSRSDKVRTFVVSLVHVFAGDELALRKSYDVAWQPAEDDDAGWTLVLTPKVEPLDKMLQALRLVGRGEAVERIEFVEPNGDRTVTRVQTADPARRFDAAEKRRLFGITE